MSGQDISSSGHPDLSPGSPAPTSARSDRSYVERVAGSVRLRFPRGAYTAAQLDQIAARAGRIARHVDKRLSSFILPGKSFRKLTVAVSPSSQAASSDLQQPVPVLILAQDAPGNTLSEGALRAFEASLAEVLVRDRFGGPHVWTAPADQVDAEGIGHALTFLALGLARYLAVEAEGGKLFGQAPGGGAPRQSGDQVVRQVAADRDGKVPLYECLMRGPGLASSPPEYAALAESFCGYIFLRDGAKAYRRLVEGTRHDPNVAADIVYGKSLEQLQDEWLAAILRGQARRSVSVKPFARQAVPYLRPYWWLLLLTLMLMVLGAGVAQIAPFVFRDIIDILTPMVGKVNPQEAASDFFGLLGRALTGGQPDVSGFTAKYAGAMDALGRLYAKLGVLALATFVQLASVIWLSYTVEVLGQNVLRDIRLQMTDRINGLSAGFYSRRRMGDMITRFTSDIPRLSEPLTESVAYSVYFSISLAMTTVSMIVMSWQLSLMLLIIVPIYIGVSRWLGPAMHAAARARQERLGQLNSNFEEMLFGHTLVKSYALDGHLMGRFRPKISEFRKVAIWADFLRAAYREGIAVVDNVQTKLVLALGGTLAVFGQTTLGTMVSFNGLTARFLVPLHRLSSTYSAIAIAAASLRRVEEVLREPMEVMDTPAGGSFSPEQVREAITFENVNFSYTGAVPTLIDVNLCIPAGSKVAFVGPTGAGKSTLVGLLPRFFDVDRGAVKIDGRDIRSFSLAGLRQSISIVSQDTFIFNSTILENIRLGRLDASDDEVVEAAKGASLHTFIESLPAGYDTLVGERGSRLSGGQKQRVAIARALLRDSPILVLDEATSALDAETESEILAELDVVTRGKTVISVTHRLGLAIKSDLICVLQGGQIVQQGSHEELMRQPGLYRKLFEDQNEELMRRSTKEQLGLSLQAVGGAPTVSIVPNAEIAGLEHLLKTERYPAGQVFCQPNGSNGKLYFLRSGQVELTVHDESTSEQCLQVGAPGDQNGAATTSLLLVIPHSASARALTDTEVQVLENEDRLLGDGAASGQGKEGELSGGTPPHSDGRRDPQVVA